MNEKVHLRGRSHRSSSVCCGVWYANKRLAIAAIAILLTGIAILALTLTTYALSRSSHLTAVNDLENDELSFANNMANSVGVIIDSVNYAIADIHGLVIGSIGANGPSSGSAGNGSTTGGVEIDTFHFLAIKMFNRFYKEGILFLADGGQISQIHPFEYDRYVGTDLLDPLFFGSSRFPEYFEAGLDEKTGRFTTALSDDDQWFLIRVSAVYDGAQPGVSKFWGLVGGFVSLHHLSAYDQIALLARIFEMDYMVVITDEQGTVHLLNTSLDYTADTSQSVLKEFIDKGQASVIETQQMSMALIVKSKSKPWELSKSRKAMLYSVEVICPLLVLAIFLVLLWYCTKTYNGYQFAPKAPPFAMLKVGAHHAEELWSLAPEPMTHLMDELRLTLNTAMSRYHAYEMPQLQPYANAYALTSVDAAVSMGLTILESIQKQKMDADLVELLGHDGKFRLTCCIHWCTAAEITVNEAEESVTYRGDDVVFGARLFLVAPATRVTLSKQAAEVFLETTRLDMVSLHFEDSVLIKGYTESSDLFTVISTRRARGGGSGSRGKGNWANTLLGNASPPTPTTAAAAASLEGGPLDPLTTWQVCDGGAQQQHENANPLLNGGVRGYRLAHPEHHRLLLPTSNNNNNDSHSHLHSNNSMSALDALTSSFSSSDFAMRSTGFNSSHFDEDTLGTSTSSNHSSSNNNNNNRNSITLSNTVIGVDPTGSSRTGGGSHLFHHHEGGGPSSFMHYKTKSPTARRHRTSGTNTASNTNNSQHPKRMSRSRSNQNAQYENSKNNNNDNNNNNNNNGGTTHPKNNNMNNLDRHSPSTRPSLASTGGPLNDEPKPTLSPVPPATQYFPTSQQNNTNNNNNDNVAAGNSSSCGGVIRQSSHGHGCGGLRQSNESQMTRSTVSSTASHHRTHAQPSSSSGVSNGDEDRVESIPPLPSLHPVMGTFSGDHNLVTSSLTGAADPTTAVSQSGGGAPVVEVPQSQRWLTMMDANSEVLSNPTSSPGVPPSPSGRIFGPSAPIGAIGNSSTASVNSKFNPLQPHYPFAQLPQSSMTNLVVTSPFHRANASTSNPVTAGCLPGLTPNPSGTFAPAPPAPPQHGGGSDSHFPPVLPTVSTRVHAIGSSSATALERSMIGVSPREQHSPFQCSGGGAAAASPAMMMENVVSHATAGGGGDPATASHHPQGNKNPTTDGIAADGGNSRGVTAAAAEEEGMQQRALSRKGGRPPQPLRVNALQETHRLSSTITSLIDLQTATVNNNNTNNNNNGDDERRTAVPRSRQNSSLRDSFVSGSPMGAFTSPHLLSVTAQDETPPMMMMCPVSNSSTMNSKSKQQLVTLHSSSSNLHGSNTKSAGGKGGGPGRVRHYVTPLASAMTGLDQTSSAMVMELSRSPLHNSRTLHSVPYISDDRSSLLNPLSLAKTATGSHLVDTRSSTTTATTTLGGGGGGAAGGSRHGTAREGSRWSGGGSSVFTGSSNPTATTGVRPLCITELPMWDRRRLQDVFDSHALAQGIRFEAASLVIAVFYTSQQLLFQPLTLQERENVYACLAKAFGVPEEGLQAYLAVHCALRFAQQHESLVDVFWGEALDGATTGAGAGGGGAAVGVSRDARLLI